MADLEARRETIRRAIDAASDELRVLNLDIHGHPEVRFEEEHAHAALTTFLDEHGFEVVRSAFGLPTAFRAVAGSGEPTVAIICEYDALPDIGHACGHNLIATAGIAVGLALQEAIEPGEGTIVVMGSPAEEGGGGKIAMIDEGAFDGIDLAMMLHPGNRTDTARSSSLANRRLDIDFYGVNAHAAARPWQGVNALDAMVLAFSAIGLLRQQIQPTWRVHGIISNGGEAENIIPGHTSAKMLVRTPLVSERPELEQRVLACFEGAAAQTGARLEYRWDERPYSELQQSPPLAESYEGHFEAMAGEIDRTVAAAASTDMGNVSQVLPSLHPSFKIPSEFGNHNAGFTEAAGTQEAHELTLRAATALALTALDAYVDPSLIEEAKREFAQRK
ncbi:MAG TPA: M20 family metallopeptidase [Dehalococcoidia bacterium]|nr:M20 family metallopeptidase [Dehalococcoidia bacterium]